MFRLAEHIRRHPGRICLFIRYYQNLAWPGNRIDTDKPKNFFLCHLNPGIPRPDNLINVSYCLRSLASAITACAPPIL